MFLQRIDPESRSQADYVSCGEFVDGVQTCTPCLESSRSRCMGICSQGEKMNSWSRFYVRPIVRVSVSMMTHSVQSVLDSAGRLQLNRLQSVPAIPMTCKSQQGWPTDLDSMFQIMLRNVVMGFVCVPRPHLQTLVSEDGRQ